MRGARTPSTLFLEATVYPTQTRSSAIDLLRAPTNIGSPLRMRKLSDPSRGYPSCRDFQVDVLHRVTDQSQHPQSQRPLEILRLPNDRAPQAYSSCRSQ